MKLVLLLGVLSLSDSAFAQNCGNGIPAGAPGCIPPDNPASPYADNYGGTAQPVAPRMIWADRWGAIAFDSTNGGVGTSSGMESKYKAEKAAMAQCRAKGGGGCWIELAYHNQCAVISWGNGYATTASAATIEEASARAVHTCSQKTDDCKVSYADCSMAERIQ